jgi:hypothetical protein
MPAPANSDRGVDAAGWNPFAFVDLSYFVIAD